MRRVSPDAKNLESFCRIFEQETCLRLEYKGEARPTVMLRAFEALVNKRLAVQPEALRAIMSKQQGMCAECGDPLSKYDIHHKTGRSAGRHEHRRKP